ncbi:MBL fold metallo-hydrolase [Puniceicoccaceae bacterium K14]|nr:MBL fold metallo-hydrolase [Puniceicoccaceae bacterium K14]
MNNIRKIVSGVFALCVASFTMADSHSGDVEIVANRVTEEIFMISGQGGNIGLFIGEDGTFLIDDQFAPLTDEIVEVIEKVGGAFPKFLINTHFHGDHTGGNENLGKGGTLIVSHHNVRERLVAGSFIDAFKMKNDPVSKEELPVVTFSDDISFHINGENVHAIHVPHAHTDGDSFIHFEEANIIHAGDLFFNGFFPFIDVLHGGSLKGMIAGVDQILALSDDRTKIIPGHGSLANKADLEEFREMLDTALMRLRALKAQGLSASEIAEKKPLADLAEVWGDGIFSADRWIEVIFAGI